MNFNTFLIGYGDKQGSGRGIYSIKVINNTIQTHLAYACTPKPGAMIVLDNKLYLSYQQDDQISGIFEFTLDESLNLTRLNKHEMPYFITSFSHLNNDHLLGSSFYDAVDVILKITDEIEVKSSAIHPYRPRSSDKRQTSPHPHHINVMNNGLHAYSVDMGTDLVSLYSIEDHTLNLIKAATIDCPLGSGPRIMRISRDNKFAYLLHEISNSVAVYSLAGFNTTDDQADLRFEEIQRITTLSNGETHIENSAAGCALTDDGQYLLVTNRGENTLVLFKIDTNSGALSFCDRIQTGLMPRDICLTGYQIIVAAQTSNILQLFCIDTELHKLRLLHEADDVIAPVGFLTQRH